MNVSKFIELYVELTLLLLIVVGGFIGAVHLLQTFLEVRYVPLHELMGIGASGAALMGGVGAAIKMAFLSRKQNRDYRGRVIK